MKIIVLMAASFLINSANASGVLKCHDTYSPKQAKTTLQADIDDATDLSNVVILPGPMLPMNVNNLKISAMNFNLISRSGIETYVTWAEATDYQADLPANSDYIANFSVIFNLGSNWLSDLPKIKQSSIVAQIQFYPDEAGGTSPFKFNMYCELQ